MSAPVFAFDVYGTLINTAGVVAALRPVAGERAEEVSRAWRNKQLEYAFRRALMRRYANFAVCTAQALAFVCAERDIALSDKQKQNLLAAYSRLPAFADAAAGLETLQARNCRLYAFSNGAAAAVDELLQNANLRHYFNDIVSVDEVQSFKPAPEVYDHFIRRAKTTAKNTWLISSNPFDILGAQAAGWRAAWIRRNPQTIFDPWQEPPAATVATIAEVAQAAQVAAT